MRALLDRPPPPTYTLWMAAADNLITDFRQRLKEALGGKVRTREWDETRRSMLYDFRESHPVAFITMMVAESIHIETMLLGDQHYGPVPEGFMKEQRELEFLSSCRKVEGIILMLLAEHKRMAKLGQEEDGQSLLIDDDDESCSPEC